MIIVGDHQDKVNGSEDRVQLKTRKLLSHCGVDTIHLVKLPEGDPGSWDRTSS